MEKLERLILEMDSLLKQQEQRRVQLYLESGGFDVEPQQSFQIMAESKLKEFELIFADVKTYDPTSDPDVDGGTGKVDGQGSDSDYELEDEELMLDQHYI